jgi:HAD superfamily hydrolase (TIGR01450 family)
MHCYIIDLDGTIYCGNKPLPHAAAFISRLNAEGSKYVFFTNSPEKSPKTVERMLLSFSIPVSSGSVITSGTLAIDYLVQKAVTKYSLRVNILGSRYLKTQASSKGLIVTKEKPDYVLVSFSDNITTREVKDACLHINTGSKFIATNPDDVIPHNKGLSPHTGTIIYAVANATGVSPFIIGKPSENLAEYFTTLFECTADNICVIGDRLDTDMKFARNCGFHSFLVLTGVTSPHYANACKKDFDRCFNNLGEFDFYNFTEREYAQ